MRLYFALLFSVALHVALILAPAWLAVRQPAPPPAIIAAKLLPGPAMPIPQALTEAADTRSAQGPVQNSATTPKNLRGAALRRAQGALSKHLFYPAAAVTQGLEGEVVLLLTLDGTGHILAAEIAKSSGHRMLDEAALDAARHIGALPGNPRQTLLPVTFRLQ